jgi:hypothetical protein
MTKNTTKMAAVAAGTMLFDDWFDPIEDAVRERVRGVIETIMEEELDATLSRPRYGRRKAAGSIDDAAPNAGLLTDVSAYYALALRLIGLNHGILIGLAAGLISFIPYLGSFTFNA